MNILSKDQQKELALRLVSVETGADVDTAQGADWPLLRAFEAWSFLSSLSAINRDLTGVLGDIAWYGAGHIFVMEIGKSFDKSDKNNSLRKIWLDYKKYVTAKTSEKELIIKTINHPEESGSSTPTASAGILIHN